jgi:hypothetical protein
LDGLTKPGIFDALMKVCLHGTECALSSPLRR